MDDLQGKDKLIRHEWILALILLLGGFAFRLALTSALPYGLNQEEASAGYDAWAILTGGIDRCGNALPVLLESWGSGQNALYSYLSIPFIALFGLSVFSVRLVAALSGCTALVFFYLLAGWVRGPRFALCALFLLAVNPWHIMASRWALESNLLPTLLLGGIYFTVRSKEKPWSLLPAAIFFSLSLYAYGTAYFFLPVFLVFALLWLRHTLRPASLLVSLGAFILIALPVSLCQLRNALGLPETTLFGLTLPALTETRQAATSVFGGGAGVSENLRTFLSILIKQTDGLPYNAGSSGGLFYFFGLPLAAAGLVKSAVSLKKSPDEAPVLAALCCGILAALFIDANVNRINMVWLPLLYFQALGLHVLLCALKKWRIIPLAGILVCFALFAASYFRDFAGDGNSSFFPGLGEAIQYVEAREPDSVFVSYYVNQPYIFVLFYTETPPEDFVQTVDYLNPDGAFRWVRSFGKYTFGNAADAGGEYLILHGSEAEGYNAEAAFGQYVVCRD